MTQVAPFTTIMPADIILQVMDSVSGPVQRRADALLPTDEVLVIANGRPGYRAIAQLAPCHPPESCVSFADGCLSPGVPSRTVVVSAHQRLSIAFPMGIPPMTAQALPSAMPSETPAHWLALTIEGADAVVAEALRLETGPLDLPEPVAAAAPEAVVIEPAPAAAPPQVEAPVRAFAGLRELPPHSASQEGSLSTWRFAVPPRTTTIRLSSNCVQPEGDPRHLGVAIFHLAMDDQAIPLESPALVRGFHSAESGEGMTWRWTDGDALLILPPRSSEQLLTVGITDWHMVL